MFDEIETWLQKKKYYFSLMKKKEPVFKVHSVKEVREPKGLMYSIAKANLAEKEAWKK